jgi:hypothetical protein
VPEDIWGKIKFRQATLPWRPQTKWTFHREMKRKKMENNTQAQAESFARISVGVGGAGCNAINRMIAEGIRALSSSL